jgi:hypothetical protein
VAANKCHVCGKVLETVTRYHKGYQGQDWKDEGPENHETPRDCIRYLAQEIERLKAR